MTNYSSLQERLNPEAEERKRIMRKVIEVPELEEENNTFPAFDHIFVMDMELEKIKERADSIKVDPTTGIKYDPVINPAPETDKKLMTRLEPIQYDMTQIEEKQVQFEENLSEMDPYLLRFGYDLLKNPILLVVDASLPLQDIEAFFITHLKDLADFKYMLYESDTIPTSLKELIHEELTEKVIDNEALSADRPEYQSNRIDLGDMIKKQNSFRDQPGSNLLSVKNNQIDKKGSLRKQQSIYSQSIYGSYGKEASSQKGGPGRREKWIVRSLGSWESIFQDYADNLEKIINSIQEKSHILKFQFKTSLINFTSIFKEKREFFNPIFSFIDAYKRFATDHGEAIKTEYCKKQLIEKIDKIHDSMWTEIENCKKVAISERDKMVTKTLINSDINFICKSVLNLIAGELNRLFHLK